MESRNETLRLIAIFKLIKAVWLIVIGISTLKLIHGDAAATLTQWIPTLGLNSGGRLTDGALGKAANLSPSKFKELGIGSFVYAGLFLAEGTGLWL